MKGCFDSMAGEDVGYTGWLASSSVSLARKVLSDIYHVFTERGRRTGAGRVERSQALCNTYNRSTRHSAEESQV